MIICNTTVVITLVRMRQRRHLNSSPSVDRRISTFGVQSTGSTVLPNNVMRKSKSSDMEAQMIWFLGLITVAFTVCWLPLSVSHILINDLLDFTEIKFTTLFSS